MAGTPFYLWCCFKCKFSIYLLQNRTLILCSAAKMGMYLLVISSQCLFWLFGAYTSLVAQTVKRLPTIQETGVRSLGREDLLEKEMATRSSTLAWKIPWTAEPDSYSPWGGKESDMTERRQCQYHTYMLGIYFKLLTTRICACRFCIWWFN